MRAQWLSCSLVLAVMLLSTWWGLAQDVSGSVEGLVTQQDGTVIAGADVTVEGPALLVPRTATTDRDGRFRVRALPVGEYTVAVQQVGFQSAMFERVIVQLGKTTALPVMSLSLLEGLQEQVVVRARRPAIDPASTTLGGNVSSEFFENLPLDRSYTDIATLLPSVNMSQLGDGPNFAGSTGIENRYFIDGVEITDPYRGIGGITLPHDFIQEVEVKAGGYEAEYRSSLGGLVNVVTPTGGDQLAGKTFGYYTADWLERGTPGTAAVSETRNRRSYDVGFSLGGPIVKDRLRFFVAYNPVFDKQETRLPSGLGFHADETTTQRFAGNLVWQAGLANRIVFSLIGDPWTAETAGAGNAETADPLLFHSDGGGVSASIRGTHILSPRFLLESWASRLTVDDSTGPATAGGWAPRFIDENGVISGGTGFASSNHSTELTLGAKGLWSLDRHQLKAGVEYRDNRLDIDRWEDWLWGNEDGSFVAFTQTQNGSLHDHVSSVFVQDSWSPNPRLSVGFGLRWEGQQILASNGEVAQRIDDMYQPRLGFVYQPGEIGSQRVYGSAARYYQEVATFVSTWYYVDGAQWRFLNCDHDPRVDPTGCDSLGGSSEILPEVSGLRGQHFDEFTLGYERRVGTRQRFDVRVLYRTLGDAIEDSLDVDTGQFTIGNPGRGALAEYPRPRRVYRALQLTLDDQGAGRFAYLLSYVWSQLRGNYSGLAWTEYLGTVANPNAGGAFDAPEMLINGDGPLPGDRTHVFKASGYYRAGSALTVGGSLVWESGTPLSEFGGTIYGPPFQGFVRQRGTAGRTPSIFDLSLKLQYDLRLDAQKRWNPRIFADVYHLLGDGIPVSYEQVHYATLDENGHQGNPNPRYGRVLYYSPPTSVRLGLEVGF